MKLAAFFDELEKLGFVSDEEAQESLHQLEKLEQNKLTPGQVGRYAALGAVATPAATTLRNAIKGRALLEGAAQPTLAGKIRHIAGEAATGALVTGAVPLLRSRLDQRSEMNKLRQYVQERATPAVEKSAGLFSPVTRRVGELLTGSELRALKADAARYRGVVKDDLKNLRKYTPHGTPLPPEERRHIKSLRRNLKSDRAAIKDEARKVRNVRIGTGVGAAAGAAGGYAYHKKNK